MKESLIKQMLDYVCVAPPLQRTVCHRQYTILTLFYFVIFVFKQNLFSQVELTAAMKVSDTFIY